MPTPDATPAPGLEAADLNAVLDLLGQAQVECTALGNQATHPLDNHAVWHLRAHRIWIAGETLTEAVDPPLPPPGQFNVATGQDPLQLMTDAKERLLALPDDLDNFALFQGRLDTSDALAAVRLHYA